jgi:hypothetical protein
MRVPSFVALAAIAAMAACTDSPVEPTQIKPVEGRVSRVQGSPPLTIGPLRLYLPIEVDTIGVPVPKSAADAAAQADIKYRGGNVINAQKMAAIYYSGEKIYKNGPRPGSAGSGRGDGSLVGYFLNNLGGSSYWNINSTYYDVNSTGQHFVQNTMGYDSFWAPNFNAPHPQELVSVNDMVNLVETGFANGALQYDPNTLYMVFTGPGVNLGGGFSNRSLQYCAFHTGYWYNDGSRIVQIAAMPYDADFNPDHPYRYKGADGKQHAAVCTYLTKGPNGDLGADATVSGMAHEIEENTTDPVTLYHVGPTPSNPDGIQGFFAGWYDDNGEENGDKCAYVYGPTLTQNSRDYWNMTIGGKPFLVQQNWSNAAPQRCLTGR